MFCFSDANVDLSIGNILTSKDTLMLPRYFLAENKFVPDEYWILGYLGNACWKLPGNVSRYITILKSWVE